MAVFKEEVFLVSFCAYSRAYVDVQADRWSAGNLSAVYVVSHCRINSLRWLFSKKRVLFGLSVHTVGHIYVYKQNRRTFQPPLNLLRFAPRYVYMY